MVVEAKKKQALRTRNYHAANHVIRRSSSANHSTTLSMPFIDRTLDFKKTLLERENNSDVKHRKSKRKDEPPRDDFGQLGKNFLKEAYNVVSAYLLENPMTSFNNSHKVDTH